MIIGAAGVQREETECMTVEPTKLPERPRRHIEELKKEIAHCIDRELSLLAEERSERARRLGFDEKILRRAREQ
jgi:hypothetical protein